MGKEKNQGKSSRNRVLAVASVVTALFALALIFFRFFHVPDAPAPKESVLMACSDLSCAYVGENYALAVLSPSAADAKDSVAAVARHTTRYDAAILLSSDEAGRTMASVFLGNCTVKTLLVPRQTPKSFIQELSEKYPLVTIQKMPWRKAVIFGDLLLYDTGKSGAMALSVTHGEDKILHAATATGGRHSLAFVKGAAVLSSNFFANDCFVEDENFDYSNSKVQTVSISAVHGNGVFVLRGDGSPLRLGQQ